MNGRRSARNLDLTVAVRQARTDLAARLRRRSSEIHKTILVQVEALSDAGMEQGPEYTEGLRATIEEALDYGLTTLEFGEDWNGPVPLSAVVQARRAARSGVPLDVVLRRYAVGDRTFSAFLTEEAEGIPREVLQRIQRGQSVPVDRLMAAVAHEYEGELARISKSPGSRQQERVRRLLAGEVETSGPLDYELTSWHIGIVADDLEAEDALRAMGERLDCQVLFVAGTGREGWAWLGRRQPINGSEAERHLATLALTSGRRYVMGEPRRGLTGWRLTHREAQAVRGLGIEGTQGVLRSRTFVLPAAVLRDRTFAEALMASYLQPLDLGKGEPGFDLRKTLRAYFAAGQISSTAAAALGIDRRTVKRHIRIVEERLGQRIEDCHAELEVALRVEQILKDPGNGVSETLG